MGQAHGKEASADGAAGGAKELFEKLDVDGRGALNLEQLLNAAPGHVLLHSLPGLFFLDKDMDGRYSLEEFTNLLHYVQSEKTKVKEEAAQNWELREFLQRAADAGVVDSSLHGRNSFRRLNHMRNIRSVYSCKNEGSISRASSVGHHDTPVSEELSCTSPASEADELGAAVARVLSTTDNGCMVSMYGTSLEEPNSDDECVSSSLKVSRSLPLSLSALEELNVRSLDAAVVEKIALINIQWLTEHLRRDGVRERFMHWLWSLANLYGSNTIGKRELTVFLQAISEDGIDLEELVFDRAANSSFVDRVINEFGSEDAIDLSMDEFLVLADLVTREYEYWEDRHLECIGPYELGRILGRGSAGIARVAVNTDDHGRYAVKIVKKGKCSDLSRLDREIQSLHIVAQHPNIVSLHEVLENEDSLFIAMEICGGGSLIDILRLYPDERLPEDVARHYMRQLFEALAHCHENGVCHRDVRLENMLLSNDGVLKLTDFGHSGLFSPGWDIFQTSLVGSIFNLSPEQIRGCCYSGEKIDIWSAGIALYTLLVGAPPFYSDDNSALLAAILGGEYELPMFVSDSAFDLLQCMIRVAPEERESFRTLLAHEWFDGPVTEPTMDVVTLPVPNFYRRHAELAEMVVVGVFRDCDIHVHLAKSKCFTNGDNVSAFEDVDTKGSVPDWKLMCSSVCVDMKFSISFFSRTTVASRLDEVCGDDNFAGDARIGDVVENDTGVSGMASRANSLRSKVVNFSSTPQGSSPIRGSDFRGQGVDAMHHDFCNSQELLKAGDAMPDLSLTDERSVDAALKKSVSRIQQLVNEYPAKGVAAIALSPGRRNPSSPVVRSPGGLKNRVTLPDFSELEDLSLPPACGNVSSETGEGVCKSRQNPNDLKRPCIAEHSEILPHLEVRLVEGDSCVFLKVCRKVKSVMLDKLDAMAERQKHTSRRQGCAAMKLIFSEAQFPTPSFPVYDGRNGIS